MLCRCKRHVVSPPWFGVADGVYVKLYAAMPIRGHRFTDQVQSRNQQIRFQPLPGRDKSNGSTEADEHQHAGNRTK
jgi:hypothetical protein